MLTLDAFLLPSGVPKNSSDAPSTPVPYHDLLSHLYVTGLNSLIQLSPILKSVMSVLSLESE